MGAANRGAAAPALVREMPRKPARASDVGSCIPGQHMFRGRLPPRGGMIFHLVLLTCGLVAATALGVTAVTLNASARQTEETIDRRLAEGASIFQASVDDELTELTSLAKLVAAGRTVASAAEHPDQVALFERMGPVLESRGVDELLIADPATGAITASLPAAGAQRPVPPPAGPGFERARAGEIAADIVQRESGELCYEVYAPALSPEGGVFAVVRLSSLVSDEDLLAFRARTGLELALLLPDSMVLSTLRGEDDEPIPGLASLRREADGPPSWSELDLPDGGVRALSVPLLGPDGSAIATMVLAVPRTTIESRIRAAVAPVLPLALLITVMGGLITAAVARRVRKPIMALATAAAQLRDGDLTTPVPRVRSIDLAPLAEALEEARQSLAADLAAASAEEARLRAIFEALQEPVLTADADGRVSGFNAAAIALLGSPARIRGRRVIELLPFVPPGQSTGDQRARASGTMTDVTGRTLQVEVSRTTLDDPRQPIAAIYVIRDISHYAEINRLREQLLYDVSHELRAPMAVLENALEILATDYADLSASEFDELVQSGRRTAARLHQLMDDLLTAGNIQSGRFVVDPQPTELRPVFREVVEAMGPQLATRRQTVRMGISHGVGAVMADPRYLRQVILNLLSNASKYGPEAEPILLHAKRVDKDVLISVEDRGPGIPASEREGLFERFYRVRQGNGEPGVGLGLAIAKGIVDAHGGHMGVTSEVGVGTTVWFTLPIARMVMGTDQTSSRQARPLALGGART